MGMMMAGTPFERPRLRTFSTESVTCPTSDRRTALPFRYLTMRGW